MRPAISAGALHSYQESGNESGFPFGLLHSATRTQYGKVCYEGVSQRLLDHACSIMQPIVSMLSRRKLFGACEAVICL